MGLRLHLAGGQGGGRPDQARLREGRLQGHAVPVRRRQPVRRLDRPGQRALQEDQPPRYRLVPGLAVGLDLPPRHRRYGQPVQHRPVLGAGDRRRDRAHPDRGPDRGAARRLGSPGAEGDDRLHAGHQRRLLPGDLRHRVRPSVASPTTPRWEVRQTTGTSTLSDLGHPTDVVVEQARRVGWGRSSPHPTRVAMLERSLDVRVPGQAVAVRVPDHCAGLAGRLHAVLLRPEEPGAGAVPPGHEQPLWSDLSQAGAIRGEPGLQQPDALRVRQVGQGALVDRTITIGATSTTARLLASASPTATGPWSPSSSRTGTRSPSAWPWAERRSTCWSA